MKAFRYEIQLKVREIILMKISTSSVQNMQFELELFYCI